MISGLGGEQNTVTCPWCGAAASATGVDAQAKWLDGAAGAR